MFLRMRRIPKMLLALTAFDMKCTTMAFQPHPQHTARMMTLRFQHDSHDERLVRALEDNTSTLKRIELAMGSMKTELKEVEKNLKDDIGSLKTELKGDIASLKTEPDSDIRKAFQDTCDELDRIWDAKQRERWGQLTRSVQEAWPDRDLTWKIVTTGCGMFDSDIDKLVSFFEGGSYADISPFLREKVAQRGLETPKNMESKYDQWARYIEDHWTDADTTLLKEWARRRWMPSDYQFVAYRVRVKIPLAATSIMDWEMERFLNMGTKSAEEFLKQSAKDIVQVYPDRDAIVTILKRLLLSERQELYDLLPETMRLALQGEKKRGGLLRKMFGLRW
jgi:hypothetical protein